MRYLYARNPKQLDICLRLLYAENIAFSVEIHETLKDKIIYYIGVLVDGDKMADLERKYKIMVS